MLRPPFSYSTNLLANSINHSTYPHYAHFLIMPLVSIEDQLLLAFLFARFHGSVECGVPTVL
jgi:hypothetical protein